MLCLLRTIENTRVLLHKILYVTGRVKCSRQLASKQFSEYVGSGLVDIFVVFKLCLHLVIPGSHVRERRDICSKSLPYDRAKHYYSSALQYSGSEIARSVWALKSSTDGHLAICGKKYKYLDSILWLLIYCCCRSYLIYNI